MTRALDDVDSAAKGCEELIPATQQAECEFLGSIKNALQVGWSIPYHNHPLACPSNDTFFSSPKVFEDCSHSLTKDVKNCCNIHTTGRVWVSTNASQVSWSTLMIPLLVHPHGHTQTRWAWQVERKHPLKGSRIEQKTISEKAVSKNALLVSWSIVRRFFLLVVFGCLVELVERLELKEEEGVLPKEMMNMLYMHQWGHYADTERNEVSLGSQISESFREQVGVCQSEEAWFDFGPLDMLSSVLCTPNSFSACTFPCLSPLFFFLFFLFPHIFSFSLFCFSSLSLLSFSFLFSCLVSSFSFPSLLTSLLLSV